MYMHETSYEKLEEALLGERTGDPPPKSSWAADATLALTALYLVLFGVYAVYDALSYETLYTPPPSQADIIAPVYHLPFLAATMAHGFPLLVRWHARRGATRPVVEAAETYAAMWMLASVAYACTMFALAYRDVDLEVALAHIPRTRAYGALYHPGMVGYARKYWRFPGDMSYVFKELQDQLSFGNRPETVCSAVARLGKLTMHSESIRTYLAPYLILCK